MVANTYGLNHCLGPVVRIAPNEIHIADPDDYDKVFAIGSKFTKDRLFYSTLGIDTTFTTMSNELHRRRRAPLNAFFSRRAVLDLEDVVQAAARKLCERIDRALGEGRPVDLGAGLRAVSVDVIAEYAFDQSWGQLDRDDFGTWWSDMNRDNDIMWLNFQQWPALLAFFQLFPEWLAVKMNKAVANLMAMLHVSLFHVFEDTIFQILRQEEDSLTGVPVYHARR